MNHIQQIFRDHGSAYLAKFGGRIPEMHRKVIDAVCDCRSGECGHHVFACPDCGKTHVANSSCGNRHCPVCQNDKASQWVYKQQLRLLPCTYFMATFTIPSELREVARSNQSAVYKAMFEAASASLRTLKADKRFVGCKVSGFFGVLHTWGRQLQYHPHLHFVIPGGGLSKDRSEWMNANGNFLVHVRALSEINQNAWQPGSAYIQNTAAYDADKSLKNSTVYRYYRLLLRSAHHSAAPTTRNLQGFLNQSP